uniref:Aspartate aminotransferase n=1 Tax=Panstrongylus megistus TaxID=65343 RepID=A0A069DYX4_9HEMI
MTKFESVTVGPAIEPFALSKAYQLDDSSHKVNLGAGVYRTEKGQPWVLPCVKKAEEMMAKDETLDHEYLPVLGYEPFCKLATKLLLGDCPKISEGKAFGIQGLSGTGSLRIALEFLVNCLGYKTVYVSTPSWENHKLVSKLAGMKHIRDYRYWNPKERGLDIDGMLEDIKEADPKSVIILHTCAHNPTGCDPTKEQWQLIAECLKEKELFPLFDSAYQGFATGDLDADAWAVRYFVNQGFELMCAQSFAKNFGLYNERVGNLTVVVNDVNTVEAVKSQLTILIRGMYSNPPSHGAKIVAMILNTESLRRDWYECIKIMSERIKDMRIKLRDKLERQNTPGEWNHITSQIGMFSFTGLNLRQVEHMIKKYHIYMFKSGRINMCGLNIENIDYVVQSFYNTILSIPSNTINKSI